MKRVICLVSVALLAACGQSSTSKNNGSANNGENNGATNNGAANNGASNNGTPNNGTSPNNGTTANNGTTTNNGTTANNGMTNANNGTVATDVTWHKDVRAIVEANCQGCHYEGGIGPFPLTTFEEVSGLGALIQGVTRATIMPPWPPADECGKFKHERKLDPAEIQAISDWVDAGTPEGDPNDYVAPQIDTITLGTPDYVADIGVDYAPNPPDGGIDDYHCFIIEPNFSEDMFLNAFEVVPGNRSTVHHVLFWHIDNSELSKARALEDSPGAGYTCFGGNRVGSELGLLGGWVPGTLPVQFEADQGIRIPSNSFIVVQIHYNTINNTDPDRTKLNLHFTDGPAGTPLGMYPLPDTDLFVAAGDANGHAGTQFRLPIATTVYGVVPHMHVLGKAIKVQAGNECLVDIPDWDFNWQGFYLYETPVEIPFGSQLKLDCWYDNSAANQPNGRTPQDVRWGEGTYDEMCLNYFIIDELPFTP